MNRISRLLASPRLTVCLFLMFLTLFCLGLLLPQQTRLSADDFQALAGQWPLFMQVITTLGLTDIYRSTLMKVTFGLFAGQLLWFLYLRARKVIGEAIHPATRPPAAMKIRYEIPCIANGLEDLDTILKTKHFRVNRPGSSLYAGKNRFSKIGSLIFHGSFLVLLAGGWVSQVWKFRGNVSLAEKQPFTGTAREYLNFSPPGIGKDDFPKAAFTPEQIDPIFTKENKQVDLICRIRTGGREREIGVNRPLSSGHTAILITDYDLAPAFSVRDRKTNHPTDLVCAKLKVWSPGHPADQFRINKPPATVFVRFFPDYGNKSSMKPADPMLTLRIKPDDKIIPETLGKLRKGESMLFGNYELRLEELRRWGLFQVSREQGGILIIVGFLLMVAGVSIRLLFGRKWISAVLEERDEGQVLVIGGRAELFPESFRMELESMLLTLTGQSELSSLRISR